MSNADGEDDLAILVEESDFSSWLSWQIALVVGECTFITSASVFQAVAFAIDSAQILMKHNQ